VTLCEVVGHGTELEVLTVLVSPSRGRNEHIVYEVALAARFEAHSIF